MNGDSAGETAYTSLFYSCSWAQFCKMHYAPKEGIQHLLPVEIGVAEDAQHIAESNPLKTVLQEPCKGDTI